MTIKNSTTLVHVEPTAIVHAIVGLKNTRVLSYHRAGPHVELLVELKEFDRSCPACGGPAYVKDRPVVRYTDLPAFGTRIVIA